VREDVFARLDVPKVAPQASYGAKRAESGTQNFESIAGAAAALDFVASVAPDADAPYRARLVAAFDAFGREEAVLFATLVRGLRETPGVRVFAPPAGTPQHPTVAFALDGVAADEVARRLSDEHAVFVSHGNFYAATAVATVAPELAAGEGVVRAGIALYTSADDVRRLLAGVAAIRR
jgi:selenocysteine lyase/cysteine desulfurase